MNFMKEKASIPDHVFAYLSGNADDRQKALTEKWLKKVDNQLTFEQLQKINQLTGSLKQFDKYNLEEGKSSVAWRIRRNKIARLTAFAQKVAAILLLPLLLFAGWHFIRNKKLQQDLVATQVVQEVKTQPGVRSHFFLPDGTEVWLNAASTLKFPSVFRGKTRTIELNGEAYFEVAENKKRPFIVQSNSLEVAALGTAFNLCAYAGDNIVSATLVEGKVEVTSREGRGGTFILEPNEQIKIEKDINKTIKTNVNVYDVIAWKDGKLIFNETPFHEAVLKLGRWFNTDMVLAGESLAKYRYTATFTNEDLSQVLELLELSAPIEFSMVARRKTGDSDFTRKQIIIRAKPGITKQIK